MHITDERIKEFQDIYKKEYGKELSWAEARDGAYSLLSLAELALEAMQTDHRRKLKLKDSPKGFHLTDGGVYNCRICYTSISNEETWYTEDGIKCLICQKALEKGTVPSTICEDRKSWFAMWELDSKYGIKHQTARKMIREGRLKPRIIETEDGKPYFYVFLVSENEDFLKSKAI